jgi:adenylate cyclase
MKLKDQTKLKLIRILMVGLIGGMIGGLYAGLIESFTSSYLLSGIFNGVGISVSLVASELFFLSNWTKRKNFITAVLLSTTYYLLMISCIFVLSSALFGEKGAVTSRVEKLWGSAEGHKDILFSLLVSLFFSLLFRINLLIGGRIFVSFFTGKYHQPIEEERIFMFLDLKSSTTIAERIGHIQFHRFINEFLFTISDAIIGNKGEIYKYVGDEVIITWKMKEGLKDQHCLRLFFDALDCVKGKKSLFEKKYGVVPEFKAGLHCGKVVSGEMGSIKMEIAFLGDVINTAARIEAECNPLQKPLLISIDLLQKLNPGREYRCGKVGDISLRGKANKIELYAIERGPAGQGTL